MQRLKFLSFLLATSLILSPLTGATFVGTSQARTRFSAASGEQALSDPLVFIRAADDLFGKSNLPRCETNREIAAVFLPGLPKYTGSGATSIHRAIVDANGLFKDGEYADGLRLTEELLADLERAEKEQAIEPLMDKWNERYPSELEVDLLLSDLPKFIGYAQGLQKAFQIRLGPGPSITNEQDAALRSRLTAPFDLFMDELDIQKQIVSKMTYEFRIEIPDVAVIRQATGGQASVLIRLRGVYPDVDHILEELIRQCPLLEELSFIWDLSIDKTPVDSGVQTVISGQRLEIVHSKVNAIWWILRTAFSVLLIVLGADNIRIPALNSSHHYSIEAAA